MQNNRVTKDVTYSKEIFDWAVNFHTKMPKPLETGIHSYDAAALVMKGSLKKTQDYLRPYGQVDFLSSIVSMMIVSHTVCTD